MVPRVIGIPTLAAAVDEGSRSAIRMQTCVPHRRLARKVPIFGCEKNCSKFGGIRSCEREHGGGWIHNEEVNPNPMMVVNQITEGHEYLHSNFGVRPKGGWQIDPFWAFWCDARLCLLGRISWSLHRSYPSYFEATESLQNRKSDLFL